MPRPRDFPHAFTPEEVQRITGLSRHMIDYLLRQGYLKPAYGHGRRGSVRYYSYRDLVVGRIIQRLRETGVELARLKEATRRLSSDSVWRKSLDDPARALRWLCSDGKRVMLRGDDGFLDEFSGQRSFSFVINIEKVTVEVKRRMPRRKAKEFSMLNLTKLG